MTKPPRDEDISARFIREMRRAKICEPTDGEYVDECPYSKTGWAIWEKGGGCTCRPAKQPRTRAES